MTIRKKPRKVPRYRFAVPISEETLKTLGDFCRQWECNRTEAARWLLAAAADLYRRGELDVPE